MALLECQPVLPRCDGEIGRVSHFHACGRAAHFRVEKRNPDGTTYYLYACTRCRRRIEMDRLRRAVAPSTALWSRGCRCQACRAIRNGR